MSNLVILICDTKAKFEKMFKIFFQRLLKEDLELIVTENPCHYALKMFCEITQKSSFNSQYS